MARKQVSKPWSLKVFIYTRAFFKKLYRWGDYKDNCIASGVCAHCNKKDVPLEADHVIPVTPIGEHEFTFDPVSGFSGLDAFANRLLIGKLQALCRKCHQKKSNAENAERRRIKKERQTK